MSRVTGVKDRKDGLVFVRVLVLDIVLRGLAGGGFSPCARGGFLTLPFLKAVTSPNFCKAARICRLSCRFLVPDDMLMCTCEAIFSRSAAPDFAGAAIVVR